MVVDEIGGKDTSGWASLVVVTCWRDLLDRKWLVRQTKTLALALTGVPFHPGPG